MPGWLLVALSVFGAVARGADKAEQPAFVTSAIGGRFDCLSPAEHRLEPAGRRVRQYLVEFMPMVPDAVSLSNEKRRAFRRAVLAKTG